MYFSFDNQVFRQKEGLPMGSNISGILAILKLETIALSSQLLISPYKRYVDDIYIQTTNEEMANQFHHIMNNQHPIYKIRNWKTRYNTQRPLTVATPFQSHHFQRGRKFLQILQKSSQKPLFVHHQSALPKKSRISFIHNECKRIKDRCSTHSTSEKHQQMLDNIFRVNGYPENNIEQTEQLQRHQKDPQSLNTE